MPKSIDDTRLLIFEMMVMADALRKWSNPHGLSPADMPTDEAKAILAVIRPNEPLLDDELFKRANEVAYDLGYNTTPASMAQYVSDRRLGLQVNGAESDAVIATCAANLRQVAHIRNAEEVEAQKLREVTANPTPKTREAYADAIRATDAAHNEAPSRRRSLADIMDVVEQRQLDSQGKGAVGIHTPLFEELSSALCGWRGLILLAAMPGIGKTSLATAAAIDAVEANKDTCAVFVSFEMPTETLVERTLSHMSEIGQRALRLGDRGYDDLFGKVSERERQATPEEKLYAQNDGKRLLSIEDKLYLLDAKKRLRKLDGRLVFVGKSDIGTIVGGHSDMRGCLAKIERLVVETKQRSGASRSFVVLDHFGAIPVDSPDGRPWPNDTERARYLLGGLITLRDRLGEDNPIVVVAQSRKNDYDKPGIASVIGTADSGYAADAVIVFRR